MEYITTPSTAADFARADAAASALYPPTPVRQVDVPPNAQVAALRADPARKMYADTSTIDTRELALATNVEATAFGLGTQQAALSSVLVDIGFTQEDVNQLAAFVRQNVEAPPTKEVLASHARTAAKALREQCMNNDAVFDQAMADAKALATRDPRLAGYLEKTGTGSNPWVVMRMAELGRAARMRGQLSK